MNRLLGAVLWTLPLLYHPARAQVISFESNGLKYQALTKSGVTVMYAHLPPHIHQYTILQVAATNGSAGPYVIRPEDCSYVRESVELRAVPAKTVIQMLFEKGSGSDVIKLVTAYENWISGIPNYRATNGGWPGARRWTGPPKCAWRRPVRPPRVHPWPRARASCR